MAYPEASHQDTKNDTEARIRLEQLKLYADNHVGDRCLIPLIAGIVGAILSVWVPAGWAITWVAADMALVAVYCELCSRFLKHPEDEPRWAVRIGFVHGAHMLVWYSILWWAWKPGNLDNHLFVMLVYVGMISAATARSNPHEGLFYSDMLPPTVAVLVPAVMSSGIIHYGLTLGAFLYAILMLLIGVRNYRNILNMVSLKIENESLILVLKELASVDSLTGAKNRRTFIEIGESEIQRSRRFGHPMSLLIFDIDRFKNINDTYGHMPADRVIQAVVVICKAMMRSEDVIGRLGGDEFGIILPETPHEQALVFAERIREAISQEAVVIEGKVVRVTASIGITLLSDTAETMPDLLHRADMSMYKAKVSGRNRAVCAEFESA